MEINCITNRAPKLFKNTCVKFNDLLSKDKNHKKVLKFIIIYWDSYGNNYLNLFSNKHIVENIHRKHHNYLSDKRKCSNLIKKLKLYKYYPKTYDNLSEINNIPIDKLFFIKEIYSTCGKGVKCLSGKDLLNYKINKNEIIQEGLQNLKLIDNKKFVIRAYIIIFNNNIYLSKYSMCMVHGKDYDSKSSEYDVQVKHEGYMNKTSAIKMYPLHETAYSSYIYKIRDALKNMKELFKPIINNSNNQFIIIGPDILITNKDEIKFIEFNTFPNLQHTKYINENVNEKMLFDLFKLVFLNYESDTLLLIK
jgi:hypothetical protein